MVVMSSTPPLGRRVLAEFVGTAALAAVVIGSGIAAQKLSPGDVGLQLLENSLATALGLAVIIVVLAPVSGAALNPVVTLVAQPLGARDSVRTVLGYVVAQIAGALGGAVLANAMFGLAPAVSTTARVTVGTALAEVVATAGLVMVIFGLIRSGRASAIPAAVGAYIGAAYWWTSSTSFANPAITIGRIITESFAGIEPLSAIVFLAAQLIGATIGGVLVVALFPRNPAVA